MRGIHLDISPTNQFDISRSHQRVYSDNQRLTTSTSIISSYFAEDAIAKELEADPFEDLAREHLTEG
jgi:hypothetical protein